MIVFDGRLLVDVLIGMYMILVSFFFQAEDGIRDLVRSRGLGDVYKRQLQRRSRTLRESARESPMCSERSPNADPSSGVTRCLSLIHI